MAQIGIDTEDITLLARDIDEIKVKLDRVKQIVDSKFTVSKGYELYLDGFAKLDKYLESALEKMNSLKTKMEEYQSEVNEIEERHIEQFTDLAVPNIACNGSNLSVISPNEYLKQKFPPPEVNQGNSSNESNTNSTATSKEKDNNGVNVAGIIAGAVGALGIGGAIAAATLSKDKEKEEKEEKERDQYYGVSNNS